MGNVDFSMTKAQLLSLFQSYGRVESISLVTARDTGQSRACGFVEMPDSAEAERAIAALNRTDSGGRPLIVSEALPRVEPDGSGGERDDAARESQP